MIEYLSSSQINLYINCGLKYKFKYIDKIPVKFKSSGLAFGSVIHSALSWFHKQRMKGNDVTQEELFRIFDADWYAQKVDTEIRYKKSEDEMKLQILGKELLELYFQNPQENVIGSEIPFVVSLLNPSNGEGLGITLEGFIDLIEKEDTIVEFKTSAQTMKQNDIDANLQISAYCYAYERLTRRMPKTIKIIDFVKTKKPKMIELKTKRTKQDYSRFYSIASKVLQGIESRNFYPRTSFWCWDCEYAKECREWGVN